MKTHLMYLLGKCQTRTHDEGVDEENEGPDADVGVREYGAIPDGDHGVALVAGEVVVRFAWPLALLSEFSVALFTFGRFV